MKELKMFQVHLEFERNLSPNTINSYLLDLKQFLNFVNKPIRKIKSEDIFNFIFHLRQNGLSVSSTNRKLSCLKTFFKYMIKINKLKNNPADTIECGKQEQRLPKPIDEKDIEKIISIADNIRDKAIFEILYGAGLRRSELIKLTVQDINFNEKTIRVFGKGGKERIVPLHSTALKLVKKLVDIQQNKWLFPSRKNPMNHISARQINEIVEKWSKKAGIKNVTPHRFRHSFCSHLFNAGAESKVIQDLAGHVSSNTTQIYTRISNKRNKEEYFMYHPRAKKGVI